MPKTLIFYDFEATSVARDADMVSIGLVAITNTTKVRSLNACTLSEKEAVDYIRNISREEFEAHQLNGEHISTALKYITFEEMGDHISSSEEVKGRENWGFHTFVTNTFKVKTGGNISTVLEIVTSYYDHPGQGNMSGAFKLESIKEISKKENIKKIYCEFTDFNKDKADDWVKENVLSKLKLSYLKDNFKGNIPINGVDDVTNPSELNLLGTKSHISKHLREWLSQFKSIEFWGDYDTIDKPMLVDLIGEWNEQEIFTIPNNDDYWYRSKVKVGVPNHLPNIKYYDFFDLHTVFKIKGINPDINRVEYSGIKADNTHYALLDASISYLCYNKLMGIK